MTFLTFFMYIFGKQNVVRSERAYAPWFVTFGDEMFETYSETGKNMKNAICDLFLTFLTFFMYVFGKQNVVRGERDYGP